MRDTSVVILARAPERGRVKTRLARHLGDDLALRVYRQLLALTAAAVSAWRGPVLLASTGDLAAFSETGLEHLPRCDQVEGDLGTRLCAALRAGLALAPRTMVIGSDCPAVTRLDLRATVAMLHAAPVALGPAADGGFWAIATATPAAARAIEAAPLPWSTADTLAALQDRLAAHGLDSRLGPVLADCDTQEDLERAVGNHLLTLPDRVG
jgi:rSAM/selenodomain-associated transferase 1